MQPLAVAAIRAVLGGLVAAGAVGFAALSQGASTRQAAIAAGAAGFAYLATRFGAEGVIDQLGGPTSGQVPLPALTYSPPPGGAPTPPQKVV